MLITVRSLITGFSEVSDKAYLSYSQSYSITKFLIENYGQEEMTSLLVTLREGNAIDDALMQTYGFNIDGLEDAWRQAIGASPRPASPEGQPTSQPTPTFVPTIIPVSVLPLGANQATPTAIPTSTLDNQPTPDTPIRNAPPLWMTFTLLGLCCIFAFLASVIVLGFVLRNQNRSGGKNE